MAGGAGERAKLNGEDLGTSQREANAAHAEKRIALARGGEAGDRLVAASVESADSHRLACGPFGEPAIDAILHLLVGQPFAREQELRPHQADAVANRRRERRQLVRPGDVDVHRHHDAVSGHRRFPDAACLSRADFVGPPTGLEGGARCRGRIEDELTADRVDERLSGEAAGIDAEADDHRHAARAGQHRHMTVAAAFREQNRAASTPIDGQKARRRQIGGGDDAAKGDRGGDGGVDSAAAELRQHAISQVAEIGGAGAEGLVFGGAIAANLVVERVPPGDIGGSSAGDRGEGRRRESVVLEERYLEAEDAGRVIGGSRRQCRELGRRRRHCGAQRGRSER